MDDTVEQFGDALTVEVSVTTGGVSSVSLTTVVRLENYKDRAASAAKLRDITELLRSALPITELKGDETRWRAREMDPKIGPDGPVTLEQHIQAQQEKLRAVAAPEQKKG